MTKSKSIDRGDRVPADVIEQDVWLSIRFPLSRRMVEDLLAARGDVRVWLSDDAIAGWRAACRTTPGGQRRFSNLAIETTLILGAVMRLPLRQTEGFVRSLMQIIRMTTRLTA